MIYRRNQSSVFLCYGRNDDWLGRSIAHAIEEKEDYIQLYDCRIGNSDDLRQKIRENIEDCTHFIFVMTPQSIDTDWAKQEIDTNLVQELNKECEIIPIWHGLPDKEIVLPPNLAKITWKIIENIFNTDKLIKRIRDSCTTQSEAGTCPRKIIKHSQVVEEVAKFFVKHSSDGLKSDKAISINDLSKKVKIMDKNLQNACDKLVAEGFLKQVSRNMTGDKHKQQFQLVAQPQLFVEFDYLVKDWRADEDGKQIVDCNIHRQDRYQTKVTDIEKNMGWEKRRLNPALYWLKTRGLVRIEEGHQQCIDGDTPQRHTGWQDVACTNDDAV